ncbi:MAG: hypothetical protein PHP44_11085 [Kiritimatiellae bacterium]|nr:hypothetical protein [Kiritimatiellia bacterium]
MELLKADNGNPIPGVVYAANSSRFVEANLRQDLTTYGIGFRDPDADKLEEMLEFVAPSIDTPERFSFKKADNAQAFLMDDTIIRSSGQDFKRVEYTGTEVDARTDNKGLVMRVDLDDVKNDPNWEQRYTILLKNRVFRGELGIGVAILGSAATNSAKTWNSSSNPDQDVADMIDAGGDVRGMDANRILFGKQAWSYRRAAYGPQNNAAAGAQYHFKPQDLADWLSADEVRVAKSRYQSSASAKSKLVGALVLAFYAEKGVTKDDPSDIKRFVSPCQNGQKMAVYVHQVSAKLVDITVEMHSRIVATSASGFVRKLTVSQAQQA